MSQLYAAYGSNVNPGQMAFRCPTAKNVGPGVLKGWKLSFRSTGTKAVATIIPDAGSSVPVICWELQPASPPLQQSLSGCQMTPFQP